MQNRRGLLLLALSTTWAICFFGTTVTAIAQTKKLQSTQAKAHVGEQATVCGEVASGRYASESRGRPTFLNFDKPFPNEDFTIVIWGENRAKFGTPEKDYQGKTVCATGTITEYRGVPQVVVSGPGQLTLGAGQAVESSPTQSNGIPAGATAQCRDGTYSFSQHRQGTCSHHGGVSRWLTQ